MDIISDEPAVRQLLTDLTIDQPPAPPARYLAVRQRARRRRRISAAAAAAAAMVLAGTAAGLGAAVTGSGAAGGTRILPAWALPWPDHRNGSVPLRVLNSAVESWRTDGAGVRYQGPQHAGRVIWYVGQTVAERQAVVVVFEAGRRLVAGWAPAAAAWRGPDAWHGHSPWVLYDVPAPRASADLTIGLNVRGIVMPSGTMAGQVVDWLVVLAAPDVHGMGFSAPGPSTPDSTSEVVGVGIAQRGLMSGGAGQVAGQVQLTSLEVGHRNVLPAPVTVGVPGSRASQVPQLAAPAQITLPAGLRRVRQITGQDGGSLGRSRAGEVILVRCYGPSPISVDAWNGIVDHVLGRVACDDAVHEVGTRVAVGGSRLTLDVPGTSLDAFRVVLAVRT